MTENKASARVALAETFRLALDTLRSHKLRSFLTLLGIILAVMTLVGVMSVVAGLNLYVSNIISNLGANVFVVNRFGIITNMDDFTKAQKRPYLTSDDFVDLREHLQLASSVAAVDNTTLDVRGNGELFEDVSIAGVSANYLDMRSLSIALGRSFNATDDEHRTNVCVLGWDIYQRFFPNTDPIGKTVRIATQEFQVIGVGNPLGTAFGQPQDQIVLIPFSTFEKIWHTGQTSISIWVQARGPDIVGGAEDEVRGRLRARRRVAFDDPDNFGILGSDTFTTLWKQLTGNIFALAVWLTSVFMVVGGIVIMNIMLASVSERTREIGIRKALGARRSHIIMQFLVESAVLSATGGLIGVICAVGITWLVKTTLSFPMSTPLYSVVISLILSTCVGLFFGIYPAMRAARLDPIEALRQEA